MTLCACRTLTASPTGAPIASAKSSRLRESPAKLASLLSITSALVSIVPEMGSAIAGSAQGRRADPSLRGSLSPLESAIEGAGPAQQATSASLTPAGTTPTA